MKKLINNPEDMVNEMLEGIYLAHQDMVKYVNNDLHCYVTKNKIKNKVALATGGGSGHLPVFLGYVGNGMLDGCSVGDVFQSPSADQMFEVTKAIDNGGGVLYIYGNYNGDIFNFDMAAEMADFEEGIRVETVIVSDDVASPAPEPGEKSTRRGVAGMFFVFKCAGAAAKKMMDLDEVTRVAKKANDNVRTLGVALSPCIVPKVGHPSFHLDDDEIEIGMGIHGEPGMRRGKVQKVDEIVDEMMEQILTDIPFVSGDSVAVLVNGLGATPLEELYVIYRRIHKILTELNIEVFRPYIGEYATSMEMAGASISLLKLDEELKDLMNETTNTPFFTQM